MLQYLICERKVMTLQQTLFLNNTPKYGIYLLLFPCIQFLYGNIRTMQNPYSGIFYASNCKWKQSFKQQKQFIGFSGRINPFVPNVERIKKLYKKKFIILFFAPKKILRKLHAFFGTLKRLFAGLKSLRKFFSSTKKGVILSAQLFQSINQLRPF